jgi:hypothetical protein
MELFFDVLIILHSCKLSLICLRLLLFDMNSYYSLVIYDFSLLVFTDTFTPFRRRPHGYFLIVTSNCLLDLPCIPAAFSPFA